MKILLVNDYPVPIGGAEIQSLFLKEELRKRGHDARIFSTSAHLSTKEKGMADYQCFGTTSPFRTLLQVANPMAYWKLKRVLEEFKPDVVHVKLFLTQISPLILPLLKNTPTLYHIVWYRPICPTGIKLLPDNTPCYLTQGRVCYSRGCLPLRDWILLMLQAKLFRRWKKSFRLFVTCSEHVKKRLVEEGFEPVEVVMNGIGNIPKCVRILPTPVVSFAGRMVREKGVDVLLRAFSEVIKHIPEAKLILAGDGPKRKELEAMARQLGASGNVTFLGHIPREKLEEAFSSSWVQVIPSIWEEPFGNVALEAMARGTVVVASSAGGLKEIIEHGKTGFLVPRGNVELLKETLLYILKNPDLIEQVGKEGRRVVLERFNIESYTQQFIKLYNRLLVRE
ncbi:Alpha-maltose-1-phosphate synthase [bacterium HR37]|nr:Alpha-maltose-1-phosphate synthase [bacterium HR37]